MLFRSRSYYEVIVVDEKTNFEWMIHTIHIAKVDSIVDLDFIPDAIHVMKKGAKEDE